MKSEDGIANLTSRENTVLTQLSKGYADKEIASNLAIAVPTVRSHLRSIYEKIHVRSRTEAIIKMLQRDQPRFEAESGSANRN